MDKPLQYGNTNEERLFNVALELSITWINRILFLKLLEAQLIKYNKGDKTYAFLNIDKIKGFDELNTLFFQVLAKKTEERNENVSQKFAHVPYLNSSLFEPTDIEHACLFISQLEDAKLPLLTNTVIKDNTGKKRTGELSAVEYIFEFLNAYDFSSEGSEEIQEDNKRLINASVLGLIFEKINGYKDGSFFTPGFITMYMCRETIRRAVVQKFNDAKGWDCKEFGELYDRIDDRHEANAIINTLKLCDPAVGSGHFLVSALNEIITVKSELRVLLDREGKRLKEYFVAVENDELVVTDDDGQLFEYNPQSRESQRVQETLFHEKQTIIENCLFGVDINPNSVKICRLRLWIELLKNAYYRVQPVETWHNPVQTWHATSLPRELETLPNIDINIKCGNSLISRYALDADLKQALKSSKWTIGNYRDAVKTYRNTKSKEVKREMEKLILSIKQDFTSIIRRDDPLKTRLDKLSHELYNRFTGNFMFEPEQEYGKNSKLEKKKKAEQKKLEDEINTISQKMNEIKNNKVFENSFEWRFEFPEVLNDEGDFLGFDVVIGNPPYGVKLGSNELDVLKKNIPLWKSSIPQDSYFCFIVLGLFIGSRNGSLSYIIPNTWRLIGVASDFRKDSLIKYGLSKIDTFLRPVFDEAVVDCDIVFYNKQIQIDSIQLNINDYEKQIKTNIITKEVLVYQNSINSYLNEKEYQLIEKIRNNSIQLNQIVKIRNGVKPYEVGKGNPKQTKEILSDKPYTKNYKADESFVPLIGGSLFHKYLNKWNNDNYISYGPWLAAPRDYSIFEANEKIIVRQTSDKLIATIVEKGFIMRDNTHIILSLNPDYHLKYILALINSKLFDFIYWTINPERGEALAQVKAMHLDQLPIKLTTDDVQFSIITLVDEIMKLKVQQSDTTSIEAEIDQLVYELYGLTAEEIKIVEGEK